MPKLRAIVEVGGVMVGMGLLSACAGQATPTPSTQPLTEWDNGRSVELRVGDKLAVSLEGNPTVGYRWEVDANNAAILQPNGEPQYAPGSGGVRGGGKFTLRFIAVRAGQTDLKLLYRRPFEKVAPPAKRFQVTVTVR
jgi:inhibitor of cysteine peptidase